RVRRDVRHDLVEEVRDIAGRAANTTTTTARLRSLRGRSGRRARRLLRAAGAALDRRRSRSRVRMVVRRGRVMGRRGGAVTDNLLDRHALEGRDNRRSELRSVGFDETLELGRHGKPLY